MAGSCIVEIVKIMDQGPVVHRVNGAEPERAPAERSDTGRTGKPLGKTDRLWIPGGSPFGLGSRRGPIARAEL